MLEFDLDAVDILAPSATVAKLPGNVSLLIDTKCKRLISFCGIIITHLCGEKPDPVMYVGGQVLKHVNI
jgi:hypothetical protein